MNINNNEKLKEIGIYFDELKAFKPLSRKREAELCSPASRREKILTLNSDYRVIGKPELLCTPVIVPYAVAGTG